ncbi:MAG: DUF1428 family protein [Caldilinea sp. CFX5]|nr:DUF1428 family protein [Caldilinea sp. CFX5]
MFSSIYIYRVPQNNVAEFLRIQAAAAVIYRQYGALDDETFVPVNLDAKYGCIALDDEIALRPDERIFISVSRFRDRTHHDAVMAQVDNDPEITQLYQQITKILDVSRILRGEFERVI